MLQRLEALHKFKENEISILTATDLAARGLDIIGVKTVKILTLVGRESPSLFAYRLSIIVCRPRLNDIYTASVERPELDGGVGL